MAAQQDPPAAATSTRKILVAIDFGTTFSGVAWCLTARSETRTTIIQWPDAAGSLEGVTSEKVPTKISYADNGELKWGFQVDQNKPHYAEFKLYLSNTQVSDSLVAREYPNPNCLRPDNRNSAVKLTRDYLRLLRQHVIDILANKLGEHITSTIPIEYIITVPAIWDESAKGKTLTCAKDAGLGGDIKIVAEPEAASVYALDTVDPESIIVGDTFVMCDAGGGTVDLISYTVDEVKPLSAREEAVGAGHKCGSAYLNRVFEKRLKDELGNMKGWEDDDTLKEAADYFEEKVKRNFSGSEDTVLFPVPGLGANKAKGVNARGKYLLSGAALKEIFQPVVPVITTLVQSQIDSTVAPVTTVFMVGGFGQSAYLRESIKEVVGPGIKVLQPPKGWTAVVQGALIKALNEEIPDMARLQITSRKARKCYGLTYTMHFVQGEHDATRKFWDPYGGFFRIELVDWILKKKETVREDEPREFDYIHGWPTTEKHPTFTIELLKFDSETGREPPKYPIGTKRMARLLVDLSHIPKRGLSSTRGHDGKWWFRISCQIQVKFKSASMECQLFYSGTSYGGVDVQYED